MIEFRFPVAKFRLTVTHDMSRLCQREGWQENPYTENSRICHSHRGATNERNNSKPQKTSPKTNLSPKGSHPRNKSLLAIFLAFSKSALEPLFCHVSLNAPNKPECPDHEYHWDGIHTAWDVNFLPDWSPLVLAAFYISHLSCIYRQDFPSKHFIEAPNRLAKRRFLWAWERDLFEAFPSMAISPYDTWLD